MNRNLKLNKLKSPTKYIKNEENQFGLKNLKQATQQIIPFSEFIKDKK